MIVVDPDGTLIRVSSYAFSAGVLWAVLAVVAIYFGSTRLPPRIPHGRIWRDWRRKRMVWGGALVLTGVGCLLCGDWIARHWGMHDLYWIMRFADLLKIVRIGALSGYFTFLGIVVLGSFLSQRRRRATSRPAR